MNAFAARFAKKFRAIRTSCDKTASMIDPRDLRSDGKQYLELRAPRRAFEREQPPLQIAQPIGMEIDVPRFVAQDAIANLFEDGIARARVQANDSRLSRPAPRSRAPAARSLDRKRGEQAGNKHASSVA